MRRGLSAEHAWSRGVEYLPDSHTDFYDVRKSTSR